MLLRSLKTTWAAFRPAAPMTPPPATIALLRRPPGRETEAYDRDPAAPGTTTQRLWAPSNIPELQWGGAGPWLRPHVMQGDNGEMNIQE